MNGWLPKNDLLHRFRRDMARLIDAVESNPEEQREDAILGDWTVKDIVAHVGAWDRALTQAIDEMLAGQVPGFHASGKSDDEFNAEVVERTRSASFDEVFAETRQAYEALLARIEAVSEEDWVRETDHRWRRGHPITVASLFGYTYNDQTHYAGHALEIEGWLTAQHI